MQRRLEAFTTRVCKTRLCGCTCHCAGTQTRSVSGFPGGALSCNARRAQETSSRKRNGLCIRNTTSPHFVQRHSKLYRKISCIKNPTKQPQPLWIINLFEDNTRMSNFIAFLGRMLIFVIYFASRTFVFN